MYPSHTTVWRDNKLVISDRRLSVRFIAPSVGISAGSVHSMLTENLSTNKVSARWVPRMLSDAQKARENALSEEVLVAGTPRRPLAALLSDGHDVALVFQKSTTEGESPAPAAHNHNLFNITMILQFMFNN